MRIGVCRSILPEERLAVAIRKHSLLLEHSPRGVCGKRRQKGLVVRQDIRKPDAPVRLLRDNFHPVHAKNRRAPTSGYPFWISNGGDKLLHRGLHWKTVVRRIFRQNGHV